MIGWLPEMAAVRKQVAQMSSVVIPNRRVGLKTPAFFKVADARALSQWLRVVLDAGRIMTYCGPKVKRRIDAVACPNTVMVV